MNTPTPTLPGPASPTGPTPEREADWLPPDARPVDIAPLIPLYPAFTLLAAWETPTVRCLSVVHNGFPYRVKYGLGPAAEERAARVVLEACR